MTAEPVPERRAAGPGTMRSVGRRPAARKHCRRGWLFGVFAALVVVAGATDGAAPFAALPLKLHAAGNAASVPQGWQQWRYSRAVEWTPRGAATGDSGRAKAGEPRAATSGLVAFALPGEVREHAQSGFADLRLVDSSGNETPFLLDRGQLEGGRNVGTAQVRETSFVPGEFTQVVLDAGPSARFHNGVTLATTLGNFLCAVEVAVSDDARQWRIVRDRAVIFREHNDAEPARRTIRYGDTTARYLRLRIFAGDQQFPMGSAALSYENTQERTPEALPAALVREAISRERPWPAWRADLGAAIQPISEVRFEFASERAEFHCDVPVYASDDAQDWTRAGSGQIFRLHVTDQPDARTESLRVRLDNSQWRRYWRIEMRGGSCGTPSRVTLYTTPWRVVFRPAGSRSYRLFYGHSLAKPPQYNLERVLARQEIYAAATATLGPEVSTPKWEDPRPWTERHAAVLWVALGIAVLLLGYSALRALRS